MATGEKLEIFVVKSFHDNCFKMATDQGRTIQIPSPTFTMPQTKNASGYFSRPSMDLIDLLIGSEGTLAAFSQIGIRLIPEVHIISGMTFFEDSESAFDFADFMRQESQVFQSSILITTLSHSFLTTVIVCQKSFRIIRQLKAVQSSGSLWKTNQILLNQNSSLGRKNSQCAEHHLITPGAVLIWQSENG